MVFAPMLEESDRLLDGLAFLLIDGTAGSVGQAGCFITTGARPQVAKVILSYDLPVNWEHVPVL